MTLKSQIDRFSQNEENFNALITGSAGTTVDLGDAGVVKSVATVIGEIAPGVDRGSWVTTTAYVINDIVLESGAYYRCRENHTSGTFATDLAAGKWRLNQGGDSTILTHRGRALDDAFTARFETVTAMIADVNLEIGDKVVTYANQNGAEIRQEWDIVAATGTHDGGSYIDLTGSGLQAKQIFGAVVTTLNYGDDASGVSDISAIVSAMLANHSVISFGEGIFKFNVNVNNKVIISGVGSTLSDIRPYDTNKSALNYRTKSPFWTQHNIIENIKISSVSKTGIGISFGRDNVADYVAGDELCNNLVCRNVYFKGLDKAVYKPFGNIGAWFYDCGFDSNKYGIYSLNNKWGSIMHAGNIYLKGGETHNNDCFLYVHNTALGFGGIVVDGTILEQNAIVAYIYSTNNTGGPIAFRDVWLENNGQVISPSSTFTIDQWSGTTLSTTSITANSIIVDGTKSKVKFDGGFFTDARLKGTYSTITSTDSHVEVTGGNSGAVLVVDDPTTSSILIKNPATEGGLPVSDGSVTSGIITTNKPDIDGNSTNARAKLAIIPHTYNKSSSFGTNKVISLSFNTVENTGGGSFNLTGSLVADGLIYPNCNEYTRAAFLTSEYTRVLNSSVTTVSGWYVATYQVKVTAGAPSFYLWNRSTVQFTNAFRVPAQNKWYTVAAIGYSTGSQTFYLDISGNNGTCTWRLGAHQVLRFDTYQEAQAFLSAQTFVE